MNDISKYYIYRKKIFKPYIDTILRLSTVLTYVMSLLMIIGLVYECGFNILEYEKEFIHKVYEWVFVTFIINSSLHILLEFHKTKSVYNIFTWFVIVMLYLILVPKIFTSSDPHSWDWWVCHILDSSAYKIIVLLAMSLLHLSNGVILLLTRRVNQSLIFSFSFLLIILIGTAMLMLPKSTYNGISFIDALFTSTSATCVTGLTTVDTSTTFTTMGIFIIMGLIQIGGIGVMTITCFFALSFMKNASIHNQMQVSDMISVKSLNSLVTTMIYIIGFTLIMEVIGAFLIFISIHGTFGISINEEIKFAVFHSISAFCNAGFSTLPNNLGNELLMTGHNMFYLVISFLIVLGGIGFPILVNLYGRMKNGIIFFIERCLNPQCNIKKHVHQYSINTTIAINMTIILVLGGTVAVAIMEWNNSFAELPFIDKIVQSFFTAICPRTAGFNSFAISSFTNQTILLIIILMMIGGGTQSTAGGIKINVFAVILLNLKSILYGKEYVTVFKRQLSDKSVRNCNSTLIMYFMFMFIGVFFLSIFEPEADMVALLFECVSALSTVGASLDLTASLGNDSKILIIALMFVGRIGVLTMMSTIIKKEKVVKYKYPSDVIIIN